MCGTMIFWSPLRVQFLPLHPTVPMIPRTRTSGRRWIQAKAGRAICTDSLTEYRDRNMADFDGPYGVDNRVFGEIRLDRKPVTVAVDFGTAYSGVAHMLTCYPRSLKCGAPTVDKGEQRKAPTVWLELPGDQWEFGYEAERKYTKILAETELGLEPDAHLYRGFKMELKDKHADFDTLMVTSLSGKQCSLMKLIVKTLEILKNYALADAQVKNDDIQCVLTVPAIWNDFGKAFMRKAAFKAGMMETEQSENLMLVLEPEGASLAVHVEAFQFGLLGAGCRFLVLNCGGGLADITAHEVQSVGPFTMKAIAGPSGGDWGGDNVNVEFKKFLLELLGPDLFNADDARLEFYPLYAMFDKVKIMFDPVRDPAGISVRSVLEDRHQLPGLVAAYNGKHHVTPIVMSLSQRNGILTMSKELMLSFFEPSLAAIVAETKKVLREVPGVSQIILTGGYASCKVLMERIRDEFDNKNGVRVILPDTPRPHTAALRGAVYFGRHRGVVTSRVAAYTYGVATDENGTHDPFRVLVRKGEELPHDHEVTLSGVPVSAEQAELTWRIYRSDKLDPTTVVGEHCLGSVSVDVSADPVLANRCVTSTFSFGGGEIRVTIHNARGELTRSHISMV